MLFTSVTSQYTTAYLLMFALAVLWSLLSAKKRGGSLASFLGTGFFLSLAFYLFTVFQHRSAMAVNPVWLLVRDLGVMHLTTTLAARAALFKPALLLLLTGILLALPFYRSNVLLNSFSGQSLAAGSLDPNAELLIDVKDAQHTAAIQDMLNPYGASLQPAFPAMRHPDYANLDDYFVIDLPAQNAGKAQQLLEELQQLTTEVDWVETNEVITLDPPQPTHSLKKDNSPYPINDARLGELWGFSAMNMAGLYNNLLKGNLRPAKTARIAILDTGVDAAHPDLKDNFFTTDERYNTDKMGHGTHCAGIAAAVSNNGIGIASFSPDNSLVKVTSVKVLTDSGMGTQQSIIQGIIEAADKDYDVISMSLGGRANPDANKAYQEAVDYAAKSGAIMIAAAGNSSDNAKNYVPAGCKGVITVSAIDSDLKLAEFSNYISDVEMGIAAPGVDILSTTPNGNYDLMSGTSMATPYVAGLAGILRAVNPNLNTRNLYDILSQTGIDTKNTAQSGKLIQPVAAMEAAMRQPASN
ncbi:subtilisin [Sphingobacteriales bacterium UPWRP_1]|nr:hypothetical protein B6N25_06090 [Sphingobacteriales bacterium TSM_CSS]PSJ78642.1 subtilisin [Sphingobacteriales bacterium UPWRP_1]